VGMLGDVDSPADDGSADLLESLALQANQLSRTATQAGRSSRIAR
jgi:hypothetical protein